MKSLLSLVSSVLLIIGSFVLSRNPDIGSNLRVFYAGFALASVGYVGLLCWGLPVRGRGWVPFFVLLAVCPRLFALNLTPSDDIPRYVWEGRILLEGYNPFAITPEDPRLAPFRDEVYPLINHKDMPAIYPPLAQYVFMLLSTLTHRVEGYRLFLLLVEFGAIAMMFKWMRVLGLARDRVMVYALNPLVVVGIAGHGHMDALQVLLLVWALVCYGSRREGSAMVLVTVAGLFKFLAFFALPFLVNRRTLKYLPLCCGIVLVSYAPFFFLEGPFSFGNLGHYLGKFEYYSLTYAPLRWFVGTAGAHAVTAVVLFSVLLSLWLTRTRPEYAIPPFLFLLTLMNTTVHYWYLIPILALSVVWKSRSLVALTLLFVPYFEVLEKLTFEGVFEGVWWHPAATYVPFLVLLWLEMAGRWPALRPLEASVGVVVPVLDDAEPLGRLLESLTAAGVPKDRVVVADGGSEDRSGETAERWGARVVACSHRGRGSQIASGARDLDTDLILILHADNLVPRNVLPALLRTAAAYPEAPGGAFRLRYESRGSRMKMLQVASNAKTALFGLSFGDQGQWFRRNRIEIPEIPLMEDVEMAVRMNDAGTPAWVPATLEVSTRRYSEQGASLVVRSVIGRVAGYLARRRWWDEVPDTRGLYDSYYEQEGITTGGDRKPSTA
jgi:hypothetical protein